MSNKILTKRQLLFKDAALCLVLAIFMLFLFSFIAVNFSIFNPFTNALKDFRFLDLYYAEKLGEEKKDAQIVLVNIEHRDRFEIYQLMKHLQKQHPTVIGIDVVFKGERDSFSDSLLAIETSKPNVVNAKAFVNNQWDKNFYSNDENQKTEGYTNINFTTETNVIRQFDGIRNINDTTQFSLGAAVARQYLNDNNDKNWSKRQQKLETTQYINYTGNLESFFSFTFDEILEKDTIPMLKNKIVLLGYLGLPLGNEYDVEDKFFTPLNEAYSGKNNADMFGVVIHANIISMILNDNFFRAIPFWFIILCSLIFAYWGILFFMWLSRTRPEINMLTKKLSQLALSILVLWISILLFSRNIISSPEFFIAFTILSIEFIGLYILISKKLNSKYQWKSFFYPN